MDAATGPSESVVISTFEKNKKEKVRVSLDTLHGKRLINLHIWFKADDGTMKPGKQGIARAVDHYKDLAGTTLELGQHLKTSGLI